MGNAAISNRLCPAQVGAIAWVVIYFFIPETKGKTLEQIEELLIKKRDVKMIKPMSHSPEV